MGSQSLNADNWSTTEISIPLNLMQNDVVWGGFMRHWSRPYCNIYIYIFLYNFQVNRILIGYIWSSWLQLFWQFKLFVRVWFYFIQISHLQQIYLRKYRKHWLTLFFLTHISLCRSKNCYKNTFLRRRRKFDPIGFFISFLFCHWK